MARRAGQVEFAEFAELAESRAGVAWRAGQVEFAELVECAGVDWWLFEDQHCGIGGIVVMDCSGNGINAKDCAGAGVGVYRGSRHMGCLNCRGSGHCG